MISNTKTDNGSLDAKCRATVETSYPLFVIHTNHVTTLPEHSLFALCEQVYTSALTNLSLTAQAPILSLRAILSAIFDPDHRAFVLDDNTPDTQRILAALHADTRACIFAQAIAGMVYFLRTLAAAAPTAGASTPLTKERVAAKLRAFEQGPDRRRILLTVETSHMWTDCFEKAQIGEMILDAVRGPKEAVAVEEERKEAAEIAVVEVDTDVANEPAFNDGPHPELNLGVPGGFSIMVLN